MDDTLAVDVGLTDDLGWRCSLGATYVSFQAIKHSAHIVLHVWANFEFASFDQALASLTSDVDIKIQFCTLPLDEEDLFGE